MKMRRASFILNILIVAFTIVGTVVMFVNQAPKGSLSAFGFANFKYYTVLSNVICGVVAAWYLVRMRAGEKESGEGQRLHGDSARMRREKAYPMTSRLVTAKLMSAAAVFLTFLTIAAFLGPIYGHALLYRGSNFFFHLIVPVLAIIEFAILDTGGKIPFCAAVLSVLPTVIYGVCYAINLFVNGIGQWPDTNDWYGFVNWGYPVGFAIFGMIILATFGAACFLRGMNHFFAAKIIRQE